MPERIYLEVDLDPAEMRDFYGGDESPANIDWGYHLRMGDLRFVEDARLASERCTEYRHRVADPAALPAVYLMPNDNAIKAAIKGERAMAKAQERPFNLDLIPGVTITPQEIPVSR